MTRKGVPNNLSRVERLFRKRLVDENQCWVWTGYLNKADGYGVISLKSKRHLVHRVSYEEFVGPIPEGIVLHHICRNKACFNPTHLQLVTSYDNIAEMLERKSYQRRIQALEKEVRHLRALLGVGYGQST